MCWVPLRLYLSVYRVSERYPPTIQTFLHALLGMVGSNGVTYSSCVVLSFQVRDLHQHDIWPQPVSVSVMCGGVSFGMLQV